MQLDIFYLSVTNEEAIGVNDAPPAPPACLQRHLHQSWLIVRASSGLPAWQITGARANLLTQHTYTGGNHFGSTQSLHINNPLQNRCSLAPSAPVAPLLQV